VKPAIDLLIVIPLGPTCKTEFLIDTISSVKYYIRSSHKIVIADDSQDPRHQVVKKQFPDVVFVENKRNLGKGLGLYTTLCNAYSYALDHFDFPVALRLDTDALIIGPDADLQILEFFKKNPDVGLAGLHVSGLDTYDDFGNLWRNYGREVYVAIAKIFTKFYIKHPLKYWRIRKFLFKALYQEYQIGELVFGGANAISRKALEKLRVHGLLPMKNVIGADLEEDHFFTMLVGYVGLRFGNLAFGDDQPFGLTWRGLPASPEALYQAHKKIIHSTRFWKNMQETEIRKYFREIREGVLVSN
jgi:hypothetical protein